MNPKTIINGKEYRFIKTVKELTTDRIAVLCEDEHGCSFICDAEMWQGSAEKHKTAFNKYASPNQKIKLLGMGKAAEAHEKNRRRQSNV